MAQALIIIGSSHMNLGLRALPRLFFSLLMWLHSPGRGAATAKKRRKARNEGLSSFLGRGALRGVVSLDRGVEGGMWGQGAHLRKCPLILAKCPFQDRGRGRGMGTSGPWVGTE